MRVYMLWHGGISYAVPSQYEREDVEVFDTLEDAKNAFRRREQAFDPYYPCVEGSSAWIFFDDPFETPDIYPDRILAFGPRGGVLCYQA